MQKVQQKQNLRGSPWTSQETSRAKERQEDQSAVFETSSISSIENMEEGVDQISVFETSPIQSVEES